MVQQELRKVLADFIKFGTLNDGGVNPNALNSLERFVKKYGDQRELAGRIDELENTNKWILENRLKNAPAIFYEIRDVRIAALKAKEVKGE